MKTEIATSGADDVVPRSESYAALDLGSNSFHLIVAREHNGAIETIDKHREMVRIATGLDDSKKLSEESIQRALDSLSRMSQRLRTLPHHNVRVVGTNALRQASNSEQFIERAEAALGHNIDIISGKEEGRLVYAAVAQSIEGRDERRLVIDIGGGSTEFIAGQRFEPHLIESLRVGCISMTERWFPKGELTKRNMVNAIRDTERELEVLEQPYRAHGWDLAVGTSGTVLAVQSALEILGLGPINRKSLKELSRAIIQFRNIANINPEWCSTRRAQSLPGGIAILCGIFTSLEIDKLEVSSGALREGLLQDLIGRTHDDDIRERSVKALLPKYQIDRHHATRVANTAVSLFDLAYPDPNEDQLDERQLLRWAALLHEIGLSISHSAYHKHGAYLLEYMDVPGFALTEQKQLAWLVRSHRRRGVREEHLPHGQSLTNLCVLLRLAVTLKRNRSDDALPEMSLSLSTYKCHFSIDGQWLDAHPLTRLDLEQESRLLDEIEFALEIHEN